MEQMMLTEDMVRVEVNGQPLFLPTKEAASLSRQERIILAYLRMKGECGADSNELNRLMIRFGGRICTLRKKGYEIKTDKIKGKSICLFTLEESNEVEK